MQSLGARKLVELKRELIVKRLIPLPRTMPKLTKYEVSLQCSTGRREYIPANLVYSFKKAVRVPSSSFSVASHDVKDVPTP